MPSPASPRPPRQATERPDHQRTPGYRNPAAPPIHPVIGTLRGSFSGEWLQPYVEVDGGPGATGAAGARGRRLLVRLALFAFCGGLLLLLSSRPAEAAERREPGLLDPVSATLEATAREVQLAGRATGSGTSTVGKAVDAARQAVAPHPRPAPGAARPPAPRPSSGAPRRSPPRSAGSRPRPVPPPRRLQRPGWPGRQAHLRPGGPGRRGRRPVTEVVAPVTGAVVRPLGPVLAPVGSALAPVGSALVPVTGAVGGLVSPVVPGGLLPLPGCRARGPGRGPALGPRVPRRLDWL